jgi:hypothetical protein
MNSLPNDINEHRLRKELDYYGPVVKIKLIRESTNSKKTTLGIVYLNKKGNGDKAVEYLNKTHSWNASLMSPEIATGWDDTRERKAPSVVLEDGVIRMREIWVGNLPPDVTEGMLYNHFFIYGEIDKIDIFAFKGFAFVRFKLVEAAARALECANSILINNRPVRISYSDQTRRFDAIGDKPGYEPNEYNARTLYVQYKRDGPVKLEGKLQDMLNRYGRVKALYIKQMVPTSLAKSCLYVDYVTHEEAENALFHLYENDKGGLRRHELGDANIEITYAFRKQRESVEKTKVEEQSLCKVSV